MSDASDGDQAVLIRIRRNSDAFEHEVTAPAVYHHRRRFLRAGVALGAGIAAGALGLPALARPGPYPGVEAPPGPDWLRASVHGAKARAVTTDEPLTPFAYATRYNNFYEFGSGKEDPARNARGFVTDPWSVRIDGEVAHPADYALEDLIRPEQLEERIYRLRCVEAWSMVIPWVGVPLARLLRRVEPNANARYVAFTTLEDRARMPGQRALFSTIDWPYVEGLRLDEAMHPLTLIAVGMYGETLPPQNGAPLRLVVPWKYGFKSIKSIVHIRLTRSRPPTTWNRLQPNEYGFYANVNPEVDHPRWSQAHERRLPGTLFAPNRIKTRMFNGYADEVASLYAGMDLRRHY